MKTPEDAFMHPCNIKKRGKGRKWKPGLGSAFGKGPLPSSSQEEKPQSHVVSQVEAVVHLSPRLLVHEAAKLEHFEVPRAGHDHGQGQQQDTQARFQVVVTCLQAQQRGFTTIPWPTAHSRRGDPPLSSLKTTFPRKRESQQSSPMILSPATSYVSSAIQEIKRAGFDPTEVLLRVAQSHLLAGRKLGKTYYGRCRSRQTLQEIRGVFVLGRKEMASECGSRR